MTELPDDLPKTKEELAQKLRLQESEGLDVLLRPMIERSAKLGLYFDDDRSIKTILGHKSIKSTERIYTLTRCST